MLTIAHLVNPVNMPPERDLSWQQPITYESMKIAKGFAKNEVDVEQVACFYPEDENMVPDGFVKTEPLEMSALDIQAFEIPRKLPLFREMLQKLYDTSDADYFIQTNADIGLQPYFYTLIKDMVNSGVDSFCINKRIIPEIIRKSGLAAVWSTIGEVHAGCDCFVFRRELWPKMDIGDIVMGTPWSETTLISNMVAYAKNFVVFKQAHATFHLGDRRVWLGHEYNDYRILNTNEFARILKMLSKENEKILEHETIAHQLWKLGKEVPNYTQMGETYSKDCWKFIN